MIELWHCADARSFRALWALEEMGLPYQLHLLPFPPRIRRPDYLELNPLGTIPLLVDGEVRMTESAAIPQYLATRYGPTPLAVGVDEPDYALWLDWLHRSEATLTFPQTIVLRYTRRRLRTVVRVAAAPRDPRARRPRLAVRRAVHDGGRVRRLRAAARTVAGPGRQVQRGGLRLLGPALRAPSVPCRQRRAGSLARRGQSRKRMTAPSASRVTRTLTS